MATTYISGGTENLLGSSIYSVGNLMHGTASNLSAGPDITQVFMGIDVALGRAGNPSPFARALKDTHIGPPSGFDVNGVPTYGDGVTAFSNSWAADHSNTDLDVLVYKTPIGTQSTSF